MWNIAKDLPWWEFIARAVIVYGAVLLFMRLSGTRQIGQMAPFDLVLLLLVSNAVQNAMNAGDNSVTAGLILAATLFLLNYAVGVLVAKSKGIADFVEGQPLLLIHQGKVNHEALKRAELSMRDLETALRLHSNAALADIQDAILETNGQISFHTVDEHEMIHRKRAEASQEPQVLEKPTRRRPAASGRKRRLGGRI
jgi:uncharacterized membrane protein YcaP (DUF421 family)